MHILLISEDLSWGGALKYWQQYNLTLTNVYAKFVRFCQFIHVLFGKNETLTPIRAHFAANVMGNILEQDIVNVIWSDVVNSLSRY